jgi:hypothetical protein
MILIKYGEQKMTEQIEGYLVQAGLMLVAIILGGIVTIAINHSTKEKDKESIIKNMKNAIKTELVLNLEGIEDIKKKTFVNENGNRISYVCDSYSFESSVRSGNFILLEDKLRTDLTLVYGIMELINQKNDNIRSMDFGVDSLGQFKSQKEHHIKEIEMKYSAVIPKLTSLIAEL